MPDKLSFFDMLRAWKQVEPNEELQALIAKGVKGARHVAKITETLLIFWNHKHNRSWPSIRKLCAKYTWKDETVYAAIAIAEHLGWLKTHPRRGQTSAYSFPAIERIARVLSGKRAKSGKVPLRPNRPQSPAEPLSPDQQRQMLEDYKREMGVTRVADLIDKSLASAGAQPPEAAEQDTDEGGIPY